MKQPVKIISVGGSIIIPKSGFDIAFLKQFRDMILSHVSRGVRFVFITGGGGTSRAYQEAFRGIEEMDADDRDWIGIYTTRLNAQFLRLLFKEVAFDDILIDPSRRVRTRQSILVAAGWRPGFSTDYCAVELAKTFGAKEVINLTDIDQVYDKDPKKFPDATPLDSIEWKNYRAMVGDVWDPGLSTPFDPVASSLADKLKLTVSIVRGTNMTEVDKSIRGESFFGTVIHP